ncbi:MAG: TonB-dependent receptor [Chitinophagaceae bacterium]|nr:TonB-dependent receptor [Chitinophagaceae bacterium]
MRTAFFILMILFFANPVFSQKSETIENNTDSAVHIQYLPDITVVGRYSKSDFQLMPEIAGTSVYAGKKSGLIVMDNVQGNVVTNTMRQVMAKIPGIHIWESDPSGIQIGIAARGLSPNRSWEFNVRQNGYDVAADPYGYPEAYYNPQLQAVQRIEVVRGHGALQYGPQFGGLVNYILRNGSEFTSPLEFETFQTVGSNALWNSFNAIGGKTSKNHYYAFFDHRNGNGWRKNSRYYTNNTYGTYTHHISNNVSLTAELTYFTMRSQQPGGLTDLQIRQNPRQSFRSRNWFDISWTLPALMAHVKFGNHIRWNTKLFAILGNRNSVGFLQSMLIADTIHHTTLKYSPRTVQIDHYRNYGLESRFMTDFILKGRTQTFSAGLRLYTGTTHRRADGTGTTGTDYDISVTGLFQRDIHFGSQNAAVFAEQLFRIQDKWLIVPGIRYEWLQGSSEGRNGFSGGNPVLLQNITRSRGFLLSGIGTEYHIRNTEIYANITQAYRPIQFANLQAPPTTDVIDPELKDSKGFNADLGYRGKVKQLLQFDVSAFYLFYHNRIGVISVSGSPSYRLVTNVGSSISKGVESYVEWNAHRTFLNKTSAHLSFFASYAYNHARYNRNHKDANTRGKKVENAPEHILRSGITTGWKDVLCTLQISYVGETFSDANNTVTPSANGNTGLIPSYTLTDVTWSYQSKKGILIKAGINNLFDIRYFTRRAGGYPGPGALPGDGRTFFLTAGIHIR